MDASLRELVKGLVSVEREALARYDFEPEHQRFLKHARQRGLRYNAWGKLAVAAMAASLAVGWFVLGPEPTLEFEANGEAGNVGMLLAAPENAPLRLDFSDGSQLDLKREARARVAELDNNGARLKLDSGSLLVSVVHAQKTKWQVDAGPFRVHVVGTKFQLSWDPSMESLRLELYEGSVRVSGPQLREGCVVLPGSELRVSLGEGTSSGSCVARADKPEHDPELVKLGKLADDRAPAPAGGAAVRQDSKPARASWRELVAQGNHAEAWIAIQAEGVQRVTERADPVDLMRLADVARFTGRPGRATQVLMALRTRFSGSREAREAAFLLGRVAADQEGAPVRGAHWFSTYLAESPDGSFAPEALGRLLDCQIRSGHSQRAQQTARKYLARYPKGSYRGIAEHQVREGGPGVEDGARPAPGNGTSNSGKTL